MTTQLHLTLDGPRLSDEGVPVNALVSALGGVQDALRLMVEHLAEHKRERGKPPKWIKDQSDLRLTATRPGSYVAALALDPAAADSEDSQSYGEQALHAFQRWDGSDSSTLPIAVVDRLRQIPASLPKGMRAWLGDAQSARRVEIRRRGLTVRLRPETEEALVYGWLKMVNWDKRKAQLHRYGDRHVPLRFESDMDDEMRNLANRFVEIRGWGVLGKNDRWQVVQVEQITGTRSWSEPFDLDAFLKNPNVKPFDPEAVVTASEPFDVDDFIRAIHEGRDAGSEDSLV